MRIKKILQGAVLTTLAVAWMGASSISADAATIPDNNIEVDTAAQEMTVKTNANDTEVLFAVGTYKKNTVKVSIWDVYDVTASKDVKIDLSKLNNTKDNYVVVKTENTDPTYIKIPASSKGQRLIFNAGTNALTIDLKTNSKNPSGRWEYRTSYGDWQELSTTENKATGVFKDYQYQGASLYVRAAATTDSAIKASSDKVSDAAIKNPTEEQKSILYVAGSLPGKETKLNIAKQANGPSIAADYVKRTIKFKRGSQYRVLTESADGSYKVTTDITTAPSGAQDMLQFLNGASSGVIEARIAAKESGKGKVASKWATLKISKPDIIDVTTSESSTITTSSALTPVEGITIQGIANTRTQAYSGKIKVENSTGYDIVVTIEGATKTTKVRTGKSTNITAGTGKKVSIAKAGNRKTTTWLGENVCIGKVE